MDQCLRVETYAAFYNSGYFWMPLVCVDAASYIFHTVVVFAIMMSGQVEMMFQSPNEQVFDTLATAFQSASLQVRHDFLRHILQHCHPVDLSFIHGFVSRAPSLQVDFLSELPEELAVNILSYLHADPESLKSASLVCNQWRRLIQDNHLWRTLCQKRGWITNLKERSAHPDFNSMKSIQNGYRSYKSPGFMTPYSPLSIRQPSFSKIQAPWKKIFVDNYMTIMNWKSGRYTMKRVRMMPSGGVEEDISMCVSFNEDLSTALSISPLSEPAHLWSMENGRRKMSLEGHRGMISVAKFGKNRIISGGVDRTLKVWELTTGQCLMTLSGHDDEIECLNFNEKILVTGSKDNTLRVWSLETSECTAVLEGHTASVTCLQLLHHSELIISGSCDRTIRIWNLDSGVSQRVLKGHRGDVLCLQADDRFIVSGSSDRTVKIWQLSTGRCIKTLDNHRESVSCLQFDQTKLVTGSSDQTIKVWSFPTGTLLYSMHGHQGVVWNLKFDQTRIVSSSFDKSVLIWDFDGTKNAHPKAAMDSAESDMDTDDEL